MSIVKDFTRASRQEYRRSGKGPRGAKYYATGQARTERGATKPYSVERAVDCADQARDPGRAHYVLDLFAAFRCVFLSFGRQIFASITYVQTVHVHTHAQEFATNAGIRPCRSLHRGSPQRGSPSSPQVGKSGNRASARFGECCRDTRIARRRGTMASVF